MKKIRINILIDFYTNKLSDIANRVSVLAATAQQEDEKPNFHKIAKETKAPCLPITLYLRQKHVNIDLLGMLYGQMWANEYELRAAKYFDFLLNLIGYMDITIPFVFALISYVLGIIVGRNWNKYVKE